jgi:hypothetical protein
MKEPLVLKPLERDDQALSGTRWHHPSNDPVAGLIVFGLQMYSASDKELIPKETPIWERKRHDRSHAF